MVWIAACAAVSRIYICVRLYFGTAMVMIIKMIAITISNSMSENPRARRRRFNIEVLSLLYDEGEGCGVERIQLNAQPRPSHHLAECLIPFRPVVAQGHDPLVDCVQEP